MAADEDDTANATADNRRRLRPQHSDITSLLFFKVGLNVLKAAK